MEGFLETFIYLLITIVILVLSMRKKKPVKTVSEDENAAEDPFTGIFNDDEEEEYNQTPRPVTVTEKETQSQEKITPWMSETEADDMLMDADSVMKEAADNNPIAEYEGEVEDAYSLGADDEGIPFDLKKAVIYSEVLNRRTF
ncbi:MAG: hypothetical protein R6U58_09680 [Bacteroidales bacterium]